MKISDINKRDPFVLLHENTYYLYGSNSFLDQTYITVNTSDNLEDWSEPKTILETSPDFWATTDFWAPEVHKYNNKFYLFMSVKSETRCRGTQIFSSDFPDGPFIPTSEFPITPADWECLDGTLYIDDNNTPFMIFCHEWVQVTDGEMCAVKLSDDLSHAISEPIVLFKASDPVWADKTSAFFVTDGPFVYKNAENKMMLVWSSLTHSNTNYIQAVSFPSEDNNIFSPWIHQENTMFSKDGGHGMIFKTKDGSLKFTLHSPNKSPLERPLMFDLKEVDGTLVLVD